MNCVLVDDDPLATNSLKKCIERFGKLQVSATYKNAEEALEYFKNHQTDLLFLDIEMGEINGIELIQRLHTVPQIIIISGNPVYAAESYNYDVVDYIVKPVTYERFCAAMEKVETENDSYKETGKDFFHIKCNGKIVQVYYQEILYVEALADYVTIHVAGDKKYTIHSTMKGIEAKLPTTNFIRVHRSFIVRLDKVQSVDDGHAVINSKLIPISRSYNEEFMKRLNFL